MIKVDKTLLIVVLILSILGLINFFSTSYHFSLKKFDNPNFYFLRFLVKVTLGGLLVFFLANFLAKNIINYKRLFFILFLVIYISIFLAFLPQFKIKGATAARWVNLGFISFQSAEIIKPLALLFFAFLFDRLNKLTFLQKLFIFSSGSLLLILPIYFQPSLSNVLIIFISIFVVFLNFLKSKKETFLSILFFLVVVLVIILFSTLWTYRKERFLSFLTKGKVFEEKYFQVEQSILAISSGGLKGKGLGKSEVKIIGIPQMLSDSIFAIYAEETGFIGSLIFIFLFFILILRIIYLGRQADNPIIEAFSLGVASWLIAQTFLHLASNIGIFVPTGVILPFFSYGASGQLAIYFSLGIISRNS